MVFFSLLDVSHTSLLGSVAVQLMLHQLHCNIDASGQLNLVHRRATGLLSVLDKTLLSKDRREFRRQAEVTRCPKIDGVDSRCSTIFCLSVGLGDT